MSKLRLRGSTSGFTEIQASAVAGDNTITLPATTGGSLIAADSSGNVNIDSGTLYVDATNNRVGIGTTSPGGNLTVTDASTYTLNVKSNSGAGVILSTLGSASFAFGTNDTERARIDSSGRLLVGTSSAVALNGIHAGVNIHGNSGNPAINFMRAQNAASITDNTPLGFFQFGSQDGGIGASIFARAETGWSSTSDCPSRLEFSVTQDGSASPVSRIELKNDGTTRFNGAITSYIDNSQNIGSASIRWATVYAATGTINTSDENLKQDIEALNAAENAAAITVKSLIKKFRFKDAVIKKGDDARIHVGVIAQEVEQAFVDAGLDPRRYALFCEDELEDGTKRLGIRYDELLAFVIAAL
jgi:hypothetical protein